MASMAEDESAFRRWSRRKHAARRGIADETGDGREPASQAPAVADADPPAPELPDIDSLDADSDFSVFLSGGVPEAVQRLALRKLWRLNPVFANLDGLLDYGEDFSDAATVVEGLRTAYRVGKGIIGDEETAPDEAAGEPATGADSPADDGAETVAQEDVHPEDEGEGEDDPEVV